MSNGAATRVVLPCDGGSPEADSRIAAGTGAWGDRVLLVAVSGWSQGEDKRLAKAAGFDEHRSKSLDFAALDAMVAIAAAREARPASCRLRNVRHHGESEAARRRSGPEGGFDDDPVAVSGASATRCPHACRRRRAVRRSGLIAKIQGLTLRYV
jgi:hypothetical protein